MARTISDEELQLRRRARRRLIGAVVLVTAIVVILPMVLDSEPRPPSQPISVQIPSPDSGAFVPKLPQPAVPAAKVPGGDAPQPAAPTPGPSAAAPAATVPPAAPPVVEARKEAAPVQAKPKAASPKPSASKTAAGAKGGRYVIQVIALADAAKARQMQQQIAGAGIRSYTEVVKTAKGDVTRVRAGPFASRAAAEKARDQLKALGMNGNITPK